MFAIIRDFFGEFTRLKLFLLIFSFSVIAILLSFWIGGFFATAFVLIPAILSLLQITKDIWKPEGGGKSGIGLASLGIAVVAISASHSWRPLVNTLLKPILEKCPSVEGVVPSDSPSIAVLIFLAVVILIVNYFARDQTAMKSHSTSLDEEFPEKDYKSLLQSFCGVLLDDLNKIDRETNWSAEIFTPLDAEVEIQSGSKRLKKVTDLLTAIRADRQSRAFLVLGDPGSGKSVALRKLCRDLLKEVTRSGKVPLYVNLREWEVKQKWDEANPPTVDQLYNFVLDNLKGRGDFFTNEFLDKYFKKMFENGRLFIILDSFDEIPSVLDVGEHSWLIDKLSDVIHRFIAGAHESRGILASRVFRKPTDKFSAKTILEIRPFTESKIVEALKKSLFYDEALVRLLFTERQEFIPIARNPFTAALISSYAKEHENTLPATQAELYSSYIQHRLDACAERIAAKNLTVQRVLNCSIAIADMMFTTETMGLEATTKELADSLPRLPIVDAIEILKYARLGRLGAGEHQRFSFVHRRFNEYFVVQKLKEDPERIPHDDIPTDSRWRDALVLYCEVADPEDARQIAEFCWSEIRRVKTDDLSMNDPQFLRAVHCLRFLKEAFRARIDSIASFRSELAVFILDQVKAEGGLLTKKIAVEAVGLLSADDIDPVLLATLDINNQWLDEVVLKSCRYLPKLSKELRNKLRFFIDGMDIFTFLRRRGELIFSLKLSNVLRELKTYCNWRTFDCYCLIGGIALMCVVKPMTLLPVLILVPLRNVTLLPVKSRRLTMLRVVHGRFTLLTLLTLPSMLLVFLEPKMGQSNVSAIFTTGSPSRVFWLACPLLMPWYWLLTSFSEVSTFVRSITRKGLMLGALVVAAYALAILGVIWVVDKINIPDSVAKGLKIGAACLGSLTIIYLVSRYCQRALHDFLINKNLQSQHLVSRQAIATQFGAFKTKSGRLKFVRFLQLKSFVAAGSWPTGQIPNAENDEASTLLAQLEEKWLGLDR